MTAAAVIGGVVFLGLQTLWRTPELSWLTGGLRRLRGHVPHPIGSVGNG